MPRHTSYSYFWSCTRSFHKATVTNQPQHNNHSKVKWIIPIISLQCSTLLRNLGFWNSCGCQFDTHRRPKHCCRSSTTSSWQQLSHTAVWNLEEYHFQIAVLLRGAYWMWQTSETRPSFSWTAELTAPPQFLADKLSSLYSLWLQTLASGEKNNS